MILFSITSFTIETQISPSSSNLAASFALCSVSAKMSPTLSSSTISIPFCSSIFPTQFPSQPLIRVYGHGRIVLNDAVISISGDMSMEYIDIDCERMESYSGATELDSYVVFMTENDYPTLKPGDNDLSFTDLSISRVVITPRWWKL